MFVKLGLTKPASLCFLWPSAAEVLDNLKKIQQAAMTTELNPLTTFPYTTEVWKKVAADAVDSYKALQGVALLTP